MVKMRRGTALVETANDQSERLKHNGRIFESVRTLDDCAQRAQRWIIEVAHSGFNRFRKRLVRYQKLYPAFIALNPLVTAIITFRKVPLTVTAFYGQALVPARPHGAMADYSHQAHSTKASGMAGELALCLRCLVAIPVFSKGLQGRR